ncbi:MAG: AAA family ATPase [Sutterella sp.]|nr:AAA family ATPase [Sutterella sp.]
MTQNALKMAPYGEANFSILRANNLAYVDKTEFIAELESFANRFPFIVRPRRFGKTLFTQTLQAYYDIAAAKDFERNFAGTYIGEHKTPLANTFRVIHFDFSGISPQNFESDFADQVLSGFFDFCLRYPFKSGESLLREKFDSAHRLLTAFVREYEATFREPIYLIIDEYDQGANEVLASSLKSFQALTKSGGALKTFYERLKQIATKGTIGRIFITGVTTIQLDSMTSGFSLAKNFTTNALFTTMFGFTERELRNLIPQLIDLKQYGKSLDEVLARMKEWYNGYCFNPDTQETVFNSSMCLNYLSAIAETGREPRSMLDPSVANSLDKIEAVLSLGDSEFVRGIVSRALNNRPIPFEGDLKVLNLNTQEFLDEQNLLSALFYMGFLTFASNDWKTLTVPNRAIGIQFFEYYFKNILNAPRYTFDAEEFSLAYKDLAEGNPGPWLNLADRRLAQTSGVHMAVHVNEAAFQMMLSSTLWASGEYGGQLEIESRGENSGFIDLLLTPKHNASYPSYVIEVKHLKTDATEEAVQKALAEAKNKRKDTLREKPSKRLPTSSASLLFTRACALLPLP